MENNALARPITPRYLLGFALPTIIMMVFMNLYTMVDGVFVSRIVGTDALSAVNLVFPFLMLVMTIGIMLASGGSAIIARKMGQDRYTEARQNFSMIVFFGILVGVVLSILGLMFRYPLVRMLGADPAVSECCIIYLSALLPFIPTFMLQILFQTFFVTAGKSRMGLAVIVAGGLTNMVLDYVFIARLHLGIAGAAWATGIGYSVPGVLGLLYFILQRNGTLFLVRPTMDWPVLFHSLTNGASEMVTNLSGSVTFFLFNLMMLRLLGSDGVAAISIVFYTDALLVAIYFGYSIGVAPLISYNYGNHHTENLRAIRRISLRALVIFGACMTGLAITLARPMVSIFASPGTEVYDLAVEGLPYFSLAYLFMGVNIFASALFTALSNGTISALLSFLRTFVFLVAGILLLPEAIGVLGLWLAIPIAEVLSISVSIQCLKKFQPRYQY